MNREQLITRIKSVIYQNDNNEIDAQKHQDLEIEIVNALLDAVANIAGGFLGTLRADAPAPTPQKNGYYIYSTAGNVSYIGGAPTVKIGDWLSVTYVGLNHIYTNVGKLLNLSDAFDVTNSNIGASLKALYDGLNNLKTTLRGDTTMTIAQVEDAITVAVERIDNIDTKLTLNDSDIVSIARMTITEPQPANQSRSQVPMNRRLRGFVLSRVDMSNSDVVEKYIGPGYGTTEWVKDSNWITLETKNNKNAASGYAGLDANKQLANELINTNFRKGFGYIFDGVDDYLSVQHNDKLNFGTDDFSIQVLAYINLSSNTECIIHNYTELSYAGFNLKKMANNELIFSIITFDSSIKVYQSYYTLTSSGNYSIIATRGKGKISLYINGILASSNIEANINSVNNNEPLLVGQNANTSERFVGNVSLVRLFNRSLNQSDVTYYENNGRPDLQRLKYTDKITNCILELLPENALPTQWLESQNSLNAIASGNPAINTETPVTDYSIVDNITNNIATGTANRDYTLPAGYIVDSVCVNSTVALTALQLVNITTTETLLTGKTVSATANKHLPITADQSSSKVDTTLRLNCAGNTGLGFNIVINIKKCL